MVEILEMNQFNTIGIIVIFALVLAFGGWFGLMGAILGGIMGWTTGVYFSGRRKRGNNT